MNKLLLSWTLYLFFNSMLFAQDCRSMSREALFSIQEEKKHELSHYLNNLSKFPLQERPLEMLLIEDRIYHAANPFTNYYGAYHHLLKIAPQGDLIELEDQSTWSVHSADSHKALDWLMTDTLSINANHEWFANYNYRLKNQATGSSLRVNLATNPVLENPATHWIVSINDSQVTLEDGSIWNTSSWDSTIVEQWLVNDVVIIGVNDGWLRASNPHILINITLLPIAHARGKFQN